MDRRRALKLLAGGAAAVPVLARADGAAATVPPAAGAARRATRFPVSDHSDGERFFNVVPDSDRSFGQVLRWMTSRDKQPWPDRVENTPYPAPAKVGPDKVTATFIGHATFLVQVGGVAFLTDPVYSERASPVGFAGPRRVRDPGQPLSALPKVDVLLVSHNHYDHLDLDTLEQVKALWDPAVVTGLGNGALLGQAGLSRITELDWWQSVGVGGATVTYTPAQHFSARGIFDRNKALWGGFMIQAGGATVYFAGDTGYCPHFREVAQRFPRLDLALLPIGAYEPRWFMRVAHMNPEDAVQAHLDLNPGRSIGKHFGTFRDLTDEAMDAPLRDLATARAAKGLAEDSFTTLDFGQTLEIAVGG